MRKIASFIFTLFFFSSFISSGQQSRIPNEFNTSESSKLIQKAGKINFSGFIGKAGSPITGEMASSKSPETLKKECTFFAGDSLDGFQFDKVASQLESQNYKLYIEFRNMMYRAQCDFIKNKYNLQNFPLIPGNLQHTEPPVTMASACANLDFEDGNFTNWVGSSGYNTNSNGNLTVPAAGAGAAIFTTNQSIYTCTDINLITAAYGNDPLGFPGLDPSGGTYSARVGGFHINTCNYGGDGFICDGYKWSSVYSNGEILEQTFNVTAANALVSFDYAVVLNDGGHANGQQPYFHVYVKNAGTGAILSSCTQYYVQAPAGSAPPGFVNSGYVNSGDGSAVYYKNWTSNSINLTPYIGQSVNIEFVAAGCTAGAHIGYAYVDVTCGPADILASNSSPCSGGAVSLTAPAISGGSYSWSGPGITGSTTQMVSVNTTGTYSVVVTPSQGAACSYTLTKSLTFGAPTVAISSVSNSTICSNNSSLITPSGATTYTLINTGATGTSFNVSPTSTTTYSIIGASGGCTSTNTITATINVNTTPTVAISSVSNPVICSNNSSLITPSGASTYTLVNTGATGTSFNVSPTGTTTYSIIGSSAAGCPSSNTITTTITVNTTPTVAISSVSSPTICSNNSSLITPSGASTYTLLNTGATGTSFNVSPTGTTTYSIIGASGAGCTSTNTITTTINVNTTPTVAISSVSNPVICSNNSSLITPSGASTYTLINTGATGTSFNVSPTGTTTYSIIGTANGCTSTNTITTTITVNTTPTVGISSVSSPTICSNNSSVITPSGASTYTLLNTGATGTSFNVSPTGTTTYSIVGTSAASCPSSNTITTTINVNTTPTVAISSVSSPTICSSNSSLITPGGASTYTLLNTGATGTSFNVSPSGTVTYSIVGSSSGCTSTNTITTTITVNTSPTVAISSVSNPVICSNNSSLITPSGASTYTLLNTGATGTSFNVSPTGTTTYSIVGAASGSGCPSTNTITTTITVNTTPTVAISSVSSPTICSNNSSLITPSGASTYTLLNTGATGTSFNVSPTGTTTYSIIGTSAAGCPASNTVTVNIAVNATPTLALSSNNVSICSGNALVLPAASGGTVYSWTGPNSFTSSLASPTVTNNATASNAGIYNINTSIAYGTATCTSATSQVTVSVVGSAVITAASSNLCMGLTATVTPSGGSTYTLTSPSFTTAGSFTLNPTSTTSYSLTGSAGAGCDGGTTFTITVINTPTVAITSNTNTICSGNSVVLTPGGASTYTLNPGNLTGTSFTLSPSSTTNYSVVGTNTANCVSSNTANVNVVVNTSPTLTLSASSSSICSGSSVVLTPSGTDSYTLNPGNLSGTSFTLSPTASTIYSVVGTSSLNCTSTNTANVNVTVNNIPTFTLGTASTVSMTCATPSVNLSGTSSSDPNSIYTWTTPSSGTVTGNPITVTTPGIYTVSVSDINSGCSSSATSQATVEVIADSGIPNVTVSANSATITCSSPIASVSVSTTATPVSYNWTPSTGIVPGTETTATPSFTAAGSYSVVVTNTASGCASSNNANVITVTENTVAPTMTLSSTGNNGMLTCSTTSVNISPVITPTVNLTYSWSPGTGISTPLNQANATFTATGSYTLAVTNTLTGCVSVIDASSIFTVNSNTAVPTFTLGTASSVTTTCANPNATLSVSSSADPNVLYTWTTPTSTTLTGSPVTVSTAGIYSVVITNTLNGCSTSSATSQSTVEVIADAGIPNVTMSTNSVAITCSNPTPSVAVSTTATPVSYNWSPSTGIVPGTETTATPSFTAAGSYSVVVTNTASGCASSINSNVVTVVADNTPPVITLSSAVNDGTITCANPSVVVTPTINPGSNLTYTWTGGSGLSTPANQANATFTANGVYTLAVTNTLTGCVTTSTNSANTFTVYGNAAPPSATITAISTNSTIGCGGTGSFVTLSAATTPTTASNVWLPGATPGSTVNAATAGIYTLVTVDAANGCSVTTQYTVTGNTTPPQNVIATPTVNIACGNTSAVLSGTTTSSNVSYSWSGPSSTSILSGSNTPSPVVSETGTYVLTVTDNSTGCQNTATVAVTQASVTAAFTADPLTGISPLTVNFTDASVGATSWTWNFGDSNGSVAQNPSNVYTTGSYTVTLTASSGSCSATATLVIVVEDAFSLEIPNVFTPNGDNTNDVFSIKSTGVKEISLQIFNRWGEKLYEFSGPKASWDGLAPNGILVPEGTYFYFVKAKGFDETEVEKHGSVNLFR